MGRPAKSLTAWVRALFSTFRCGECVRLHADILFLKQDCSIFRCSISKMEQVRLCVFWPMKNWLGSSLNQIPLSENPTPVL